MLRDLILAKSGGTGVPPDLNFQLHASPTTSALYATTYGAGLYTVLGGNQCYNTTDGINFTTHTVPGNRRWWSVSFNGGQFATVDQQGNNKAMHSTDGMSWTEVSTPAGYWERVVYGSGRFAAISSNTGATVHSIDGTNWLSGGGVEPDIYWTALGYGNNQFVGLSAKCCATSPDGITWIPRTIPGNSTQTTGWKAVAYGAGLWVAIATPGNTFLPYYMTSPDGITWTEHPHQGQNIVIYGQDIIYANGRFVILRGGTDNNTKSEEYYTSYDGITWARYIMPKKIDWRSITYGNGKFFAVGFGGNTAISTA